MIRSRQSLIVALFLILSAWTSLLAAELKPASMFTDNMVLQRESKTAIWGTGEAGKTVTVTLDGKRASAKTDAAGKWMAHLKTGAAGGPFDLTVSDGSAEKAFKNVMLGEVWLCPGQSNMAFITGQAINGVEEAKTADNYPQIRLYEVNKWGSFAAKPMDSAGGKWEVCSADTVTSFSAVAYFFARSLADTSLKGVPIGLIDAGRGATRIESWIDKPTLAKHFDMSELRDSFFGATISSCYNGMIYPVIPYGIRGVVWYQAESNASRPVQYKKLFKLMVSDWRKRFGQKNMPFLTVQLPNFAQKFDDDYFTNIREAQKKCAKEVPHTYMAVTIDIGAPKDVHPKNKQDVGLRLALLARAKVYGEKGVVYSGPVLKCKHVEGDRMRLKFKHADGRLTNKNGGNLEGFEVAGKDLVFRPADARIDSDTVVVYSEQVPKPKYLRYAWAPDPKADLYNAAGLPAAPFRTDKIKIEDKMGKPEKPQAAPSLGTK